MTPRLIASELNPLLHLAEEATSHLVTILESSDDAIVIKAPDGTVVTWNSGAERIYRYSADEATGRQMTFLLPPDRRDEESEILERVRRGQRIEHFETVRLTKDGRPIDVSLNISPICDRAGRTVDISHIARDITERKQAEASISRLAAIVESSNDAVVSTTPDAAVLSWNSGAERIYGYTAAEAMGRQMAFLLPPERHDEAVGILERIRQGEQLEHFETVRLTKDGRRIHVSLSIFPVRDRAGRIIAISHVASDITGRKQAEAGISHLAAIVESSDDAIVSKTPDGKVLSWNSGAERIYGYSAAEAVGRTMTFLLPPDRRDEEKEILERIHRHQLVEHFETIRLRKDGRTIHVSLSISPVRDSAGSIVAVSHIARDITERKQFEARLLRIENHKLESISVLAAGVAHDFNNLLTGVLGNASLLLERTRNSEDDRGHLIEIIDSSQRAAHLTRQLLAYAGKGKMVAEPVDISEIVFAACKLARASMPKTVQLSFDREERLPEIEADLAQIEQALINLILNGAEAIGKDTPGTVKVTTRVRRVDELFLLTLSAPATIAPGTYVEVEVQDSGCGMDERTMSRIFDPFFTTKFTGRGLGLAAVQGIVRGHRGHIRVSSVVGRGTTFKILFPAVKTESPAEACAQARKTVPPPAPEQPGA